MIRTALNCPSCVRALQQGSAAEPFQVLVHCSPFVTKPWDACGSLAGVPVAVMGPPREVPLAKFSEWPL